MPDAPAPDDLAALRDQLARADEQILALAAERMKLVKLVAEQKGRSGSAPFDRAQEAVKMRELGGVAVRHGVPEALARDLFGVLFAASRGAQRAYLLEELPRFSIGIVGGTAGMGAFLARVFGAAG